MPQTGLVDYRDRSAEFLSTVESFKQKSETKEPLVSPDAKSSKQKSKFGQAAAHVMNGINNISKKLEQLTLLTRNTSLYLDRPDDINQMTFELKQDMQTLRSEITVLQTFVSQAESDSNNDLKSNSNIIVNSLSSQLASQTKTLMAVLTSRTKSLRHQSERRKKFDSSRVMRKPKSRRGFSHILQVEDAPQSEQTGVQPTAQTSLLAQEEPAYADAFLESRADAVENIERTVAELGVMYRQVADMAIQQGEVAIRIDRNTEVTLENVQGGYNELVKLYDSVGSGQWLAIKVFFILLVFAAFFIVFVA